jgi:hypothetical protein
MKLKRCVKKLKGDCRRLPVSSDIRIYLLLLAHVEYFIRDSLYSASPTTETLPPFP